MPPTMSMCALISTQVEPLIACPDSPDNVCPVRQVAGTAVDQVAVGSCTNSSYADLMAVAEILKGRKVHPRVNLVVSPGLEASVSDDRPQRRSG